MMVVATLACRGGSKGRAHPAHAPPKIGKNMIFWRKIVIFSDVNVKMNLHKHKPGAEPGFQVRGGRT
jgi:hypothetical protein